MEITLQGVRTAALVCAAVAVLVAVVERRALLRVLRTFFLEPGSAVGLALMRITVFWLLFEYASPEWVLRFTSLPEVLRKLPDGWGWLAPVLPFDATSARAITIAFGIASGCAVAGLCTRVTAPIAALLGLYVMGVPNFYGKIDHAAHCTALSALILAVAPCGDALSLDRLWRRYRGQAPPPLSAAYTLPLRFCFLILGTVYLFPGLWKLWRAGDTWLTGVQLPALLRAHWSKNPDFVAPFRVDDSPLLMQVLGAATLLFEIGFIFLLFNRWTRVLAAFSAVVFHWSISVLMGIRFHILYPLVLLYDLPGLPDALAARFPRLSRPFAAAAGAVRARIDEQLSRWFGEVATSPPSRMPRWIAPALAGSVLFGAQLVAGALAIDSWPIAVHPRFDRRMTSARDTRERLAVVVDRASGGRSIDMTDQFAALGRTRGELLVRRLNSLYRRPSSDPDRIAAERAVIDLLAQNGVKLEVGDRISLLREKWRMFPLDQRDGLKQTVMRRWELTPEGRLGPQTERWTKRKKKRSSS
jgi:Vitamin K-dependent gamma-carboxylase